MLLRRAGLTASAGLSCYLHVSVATVDQHNTIVEYSYTLHIVTREGRDRTPYVRNRV